MSFKGLKDFFCWLNNFIGSYNRTGTTWAEFKRPPTPVLLAKTLQTAAGLLIIGAFLIINIFI